MDRSIHTSFRSHGHPIAFLLALPRLASLIGRTALVKTRRAGLNILSWSYHYHRGDGGGGGGGDDDDDEDDDFFFGGGCSPEVECQ